MAAPGLAAQARHDSRSFPLPTGLLTDHYELTMVDAALRSGIAERRAVFECFCRRLPSGRRYGVVAGIDRVLEAIEQFRFDATELQWLAGQGFLHAETIEWLAGYRFSGTITGYAEGELFMPDSPVLTVEAPFAEAVVLETLVLSILNYDCAVAAAGARMVTAARGRPLLEAGSRRTSEYAAPAAARAAYLVGFAASSNLEAGLRWGVPTGGTVAHAFVLAFRDERTAFEAQLAQTGAGTTLLVDTYDVETGIRHAVAAAGTGLDAVRIDSGDLLTQSRRARALLDELGAASTKIVLSGDLDEWAIEQLVRDGAPVDRMLVGTQLVTGSGAPAAGLVYKLVAAADRPGADAPLHPVSKLSAGKATVGGRKAAFRRLDPSGRAVEELVVHDADPLAVREDLRPLQRVYVEDGWVLGRPTLQQSRAHHARALAELAPEHLALDPGDPALPVRR